MGHPMGHGQFDMSVFEWIASCAAFAVWLAFFVAHIRRSRKWLRIWKAQDDLVWWDLKETARLNDLIDEAQARGDYDLSGKLLAQAETALGRAEMHIAEQDKLKL